MRKNNGKQESSQILTSVHRFPPSPSSAASIKGDLGGQLLQLQGVLLNVIASSGQPRLTEAALRAVTQVNCMTQPQNINEVWEKKNVKSNYIPVLCAPLIDILRGQYASITTIVIRKTFIFWSSNLGPNFLFGYLDILV